MAIFIFLFVFGLYLRTLNPSVGLYDAGDMTTAAALLGIPHPPGYPFYCLFGKLITYIFPFGNIAYRINMLSALCGSLACFFVFLITKGITGLNFPALFSSLFLTFSYSVWQQSTFAGQYIGHLTFGVLLIFLIIKSQDSPRYLYLFSYILGLSLTHHRQTLFVAFGGFIFLLVKSIFSIRKKRKRKKILSLIKSYLINCALVFILFLIPLLLYLYLPIRASCNPPLNWGDPDTLQRLISHIKGEQYGFLFLKLSPKEHILRIISQIQFFPNQLTYPVVVFGIIGIILMAIRNGSYFLLLFSIISVNIFTSATFNHPSIELHYLLPCAIFVIFSGYTIASLIKLLKRFNPYLAIFPILFLGLCGHLFLKNYPLNNRSKYYFTYDYGMNILRPIAKNAVVFVSDDTHTFPTEYFYYVEKAREDISLVDTHLLEFEWKANLIKEQFPDLSFDFWPPSVRKQYPTYDEVSFAREVDMIEKSIDKRPFYIFPHPTIAQFYEFLPSGVFSRILKKDISKEKLLQLLDETKFDFKARKMGFMDSSADVDFINYGVSHYNRARLYYNAGEYKEVILELDKAIGFNPNYIQAKELRERIKNL